jgi:hypothetical protein
MTGRLDFDLTARTAPGTMPRRRVFAGTATAEGPVGAGTLLGQMTAGRFCPAAVCVLGAR